MDTATRRELEHLRARAFGPDADIYDDPEALRRLRELEEASRPADGGAAPPIESSADEARTDDPESVESDEPDAPTEADEPARPRKVAQRLLWIGSAVLVAVVAVAATLSVTSIAAISTNPNARHVGTAAASDSAPWPPAFGDQGEGIVYEDFAGFTAVLQGANINGYEDLRCMIVLRTEDVEPSSEGFRDSFYGCGAGDFPVSAVVPITGSAPDAARERFAVGSVLQFVVNGDRVDVFSDDD